MSNRWTLAYRITVIALLAMIALQLGGWKSIKETWRDASRAVTRAGLPDEEPAAPKAGEQQGGIGLMYGEASDADMQRFLKERQQREKDTAPTASPR